MHGQLCETIRGQLPDVFVIEPLQLIHVEPGIVAQDLGQIENLDDILDGQLFAVVLGRPAEQAQIVHHRFRSEPFLHVGAERCAESTLTHLGSVLIQD